MYASQLEDIVINIFVLSTILVIKVIEVLALFNRKEKKPRYIPYQFVLYLVSFAMIMIIGPEVLNLIFREAIEVTFAMYLMLAFLTRSL